MADWPRAGDRRIWFGDRPSSGAIDLVIHRSRRVKGRGGPRAGRQPAPGFPLATGPGAVGLPSNPRMPETRETHHCPIAGGPMRAKGCRGARDERAIATRPLSPVPGPHHALRAPPPTRGGLEGDLVRHGAHAGGAAGAGGPDGRALHAEHHGCWVMCWCRKATGNGSAAGEWPAGRVGRGFTAPRVRRPRVRGCCPPLRTPGSRRPMRPAPVGAAACPGRGNSARHSQGPRAVPRRTGSPARPAAVPRGVAALKQRGAVVSHPSTRAGARRGRHAIRPCRPGPGQARAARQ